MSDTPRTDSEAGEYFSVGYWRKKPDGECVDSDFARQLERELAEAKKHYADALEHWQSLHENDRAELAAETNRCEALRRELAAVTAERDALREDKALLDELSELSKYGVTIQQCEDGPFLVNGISRGREALTLRKALRTAMDAARKEKP